MIHPRIPVLDLLASAARPRHMLLALAMLGGAAGPAAAQSLGLGRLFTTPEERIAINMRRGSATGPSLPNAMPPTAAGPAPEAATPTPPPEPALLNGVVRRSSGKSTVWINDVPYADSSAQLRSDQSVKLRLSSGRALVLKPGQRFNPADGTVQEAAGR